MGEPGYENCICNWSLGMGPDLKCPVHGRPELYKDGDKMDEGKENAKVVERAKGLSEEIRDANEMKPKKAVVLLSGGMDSAVCLAKALYDGYEVYPLMFQYGQRHSIEQICAGDLLTHFGKLESFDDWPPGPKVIHARKVFKIDLTQIGGSALTADIPMPKGEQEGIPTSYVPGRNVIFLSVALAYAEVKGCNKVIYGANIVDFSGYPDCRPEFVAAMNEVSHVGYKSGIEGQSIFIEIPIINMSKKEIVELGRKLGVPFELTWSCYDPQVKKEIKDLKTARSMTYKDVACGVCPACVLRLKGFFEAGWPDPVEYAFDGDGNHCPQCRRTNLAFSHQDGMDVGGCKDCGWSI